MTILYNSITVTEEREIYVSHDLDQGTLFNLGSVKDLLRNKCFSNSINVIVGGENGRYGPDVQPSKKSLKRLNKLLHESNYKIVNQQGQRFTLQAVI